MLQIKYQHIFSLFRKYTLKINRFIYRLVFLINEVIRMKIRDEDIQIFFKKHVITTYEQFSKEFSISSVWARQVLRSKVISSINFNGKYITQIEDKKFDDFGIIKINDIIFSKHGSIKQTLLYLIKTYDKINSKKIYSILRINPSQQLTILLKQEQIFAKKEGRTYKYSIHFVPQKTTEKIDFDIRSLDEKDIVLRNLEIIRQVKSGKKKTDIAKIFKITPETVYNICKKFDMGKTKGLVRARKQKTTKISSSIQAAIITEAVKHPEKSPGEIKKSLQHIKSVSLKTITKTVDGVKDSIKLKKKLLLEIQ